MKKSTLNKIERKRNNLPLYFVDSPVFLEVLMGQINSEHCSSFFHRASYKYRLITSTIVLGEIIKALNRLDGKQLKTESLLMLADLFERTKINIVAISFESINNTSAIKEVEPYLLPSDCLIFSSAITENADAFITLDSDFSQILATEFNINIKKPSEA